LTSTLKIFLNSELTLPLSLYKLAVRCDLAVYFELGPTHKTLTGMDTGPPQDLDGDGYRAFAKPRRKNDTGPPQDLDGKGFRATPIM
jgi:hypothetical protein